MHAGSEESAWPLLLPPTATTTLASFPHYYLVSGTGGLLWLCFSLLLEDQLCDGVKHLWGWGGVRGYTHCATTHTLLTSSTFLFSFALVS